MINSTLGRYRNLLTNISNWREYFAEKKRRGAFEPMEFTTRGNPMRFSVPSKGLYLVFKEIFLTDFYAMRELARSLPADPVVIDVGGNAGYFAMMLMSKVPRARVYAYEPIAANHALYSAHIARNPSLHRRVTVHHAAVTGTAVESVELFAEAEGSSVTASVFAEFDALKAKAGVLAADALTQIETVPAAPPSVTAEAAPQGSLAGVDVVQNAPAAGASKLFNPDISVIGNVVSHIGGENPEGRDSIALQEAELGLEISTHARRRSALRADTT